MADNASDRLYRTTTFEPYRYHWYPETISNERRKKVRLFICSFTFYKIYEGTSGFYPYRSAHENTVTSIFSVKAKNDFSFNFSNLLLIRNFQKFCIIPKILPKTIYFSKLSEQFQKKKQNEHRKFITHFDIG